MSLTVKYQSKQQTRGESGSGRSIVYYGTAAELDKLFDESVIGAGSGGEEITNVRRYKGEGGADELEIAWQNKSVGGWVSGPDARYGQKSAQLTAGRMSMPLERLKGYRAKWNYFLATCDETIDWAPDWWADATNTAIEKPWSDYYRWVKSPSDLPYGKDQEGNIWTILEKPTKPGVESYDFATCQVVESAKFSSAKSAGKMIVGKMNRIGTPVETFGLTGGNWKCDAASISWTGKYWLATLTWTLSGDDKGWDLDFYDKVAED